MFRVGDFVDGRFRVDGVCSESGGMGVILHVSPVAAVLPYRVVLKYCRGNDEEQLRRFRREVRLMASYKGNSKVAQIIEYNLDYDPPYYVMKFYAEGDISTLVPALRSSHELQERCFLQMIDCVQELHSRNEYHRDIKPANFLLDGQQIIVSDFGLTTEIGSNTAFTRSSAWWGTHGFIPPEFLDGGFKHADASGDIFMFGKTFYALLTGRDPTYLERHGVPAPLFHIIDRCCSVSKDSRYRTLADLKQSLAAAYDVLLQRLGGLGKVKQLLSSIGEKFEAGGNYDQREILEFVEQLALVDEAEQVRVCFELPAAFFLVIGQRLSVDSLPTFLRIYERLWRAGTMVGATQRQLPVIWAEYSIAKQRHTTRKHER